MNKKPQTKAFGGVTGSNLQPSSTNNRPPSGGPRTSAIMGATGSAIGHKQPTTA